MESSSEEKSSVVENSSEEKSSEVESSSEEKSSVEESSDEEKSSTEESSSEEKSTEEESSDEKESTTEETTEEEEGKNPAASTNAEGGNVLKNGSFENTVSATSINPDNKGWKNDLAPADFGKVWQATPGTGGMSFAIEDDTNAKDGGKVFHISSTDATARWDLAQSSIEIDTAKEYECTFWVKAENVTGTGMYMVLKRMVPGDGTKESVTSKKITGSTEGWVQYRFTTETLPFEAGNQLQLDIFGEYMTGDVWVDDIRITPIEEEANISISDTTLTLEAGKTHQLSVTGADTNTVTWKSDKEAVATVDADGLVTAVGAGEATITATVNGKDLTCKVTVKDSNILANGSFEKVKDTTDAKWTNGKMPDGFNPLWANDTNKGNQEMDFTVEESTEARHGKNVLHISSAGDAVKERWDLAAPNNVIDPSKKYECTFWAKTENVTGTGFYLVLKRQQASDNKTAETQEYPTKLTGTKDWTQYKFEVDLPFQTGDKLQLDIMAEYMTGDVWVDDIRITPIDDGTGEVETIALNRSTLTLIPEKMHQLKVTGADGEEITWASSDEAIATVDNTGLVTAVAIGEAEITATVNGKTLTCKVTVKAPVEGETVVFSDDFEGELATSTNTTMQKYWKDSQYPVQWDSIGFGTGSYAGDLQLEVTDADAYEGDHSVHVSTQDSATRISMTAKIADLDFTKEYVLRMQVKTKDVTGTGFYARSQIQANGKYVNLGDGHKLKGTNDWTLYELPYPKVPELAAGQESGAATIEVFAEKMTGEIWIDNVELVEVWSLKLDKKDMSLDIGETGTITASGMPADKTVTWSSEDETIAAVDKDGKVTAIAPGVVEITASVDADHKAVCTVVVKDPEAEVQFQGMRDRWIERLTGNSMWKGDATSNEYKKILASNEEKAEEAREKLVKDSETELFNDLNLTMDLYKKGSTSTTSTDSEAYTTAVSRIQSMAVVYASEGSKYYQDEALKEDILYAVQWYYDNVWNEELNNQAMFGNWYHWWISLPQGVSSIVILMHDEMSEELIQSEAKVLKHFNEDPKTVYKVKGAAGPMEMTGANLADTSLASQLRGAACSDPLAVVNGTKYFDEFISIVEKGKEGILSDGSFIQHTNLAYTGGYGSTLLNNAEKLVYVSAGTDWEVESEKLDVLWNFIWDGIRPLYADGAMFDMVEGRGLARPTASDLKTGRVILEAVALLSNSAPDEWRGKLKSFVKYQAQAGISAMGEETYFTGRSGAAISAIQGILNDSSIEAVDNAGYAKVFGGMDKAVSHNPDFSLGISYASARTGRFEFGNEENKQGWHQGDGATYIYNGDPNQYSDNYWNTVDNQRLAGITTDHSTWNLANWGNYPGNANLNGGSSVGQFATVSMNFKNYKDATNPNLAARKSWFVFDNEVVALGMGISGIDTNRTTETIVENKKINGDNKLIIDGAEQSTAIDNQTNSLSNVSWAWLEGNTDKDAMGYYFPEGSKLDVLRESREGSWADINGSAGMDATKITRNYLSLAVPHGENANNKLDSFKKESYSYVLLPSMNSEEVKAYAENPDIQVLCNSTFAQAVVDHKANAAGYIFWGDISTPVRIGEVEGTVGSVTTAKDPQTHTMKVGIADVHQNKDSLTFRIYGNNLSMAVGNDKVKAEFDKYGVILTVDTKDAMGATIEVTLNYEDLPQEQLDQLASMRETYANGLTGNDMSDKTDAEYLTYMKKYEDAATAALEQLNMDAGKGTKLFNDIELLDWENKGAANGDGSATLTTTTTRIKDIVMAYKSQGTKYYNDPEVKKAIDVCLEYLMSGFPNILNYHDRVFANWWDWSIGVPKDLTIVGILLYDDLDESYRRELYNMIQILVPDVNYYWGRSANGRAARFAATGANGSEMAMNTVLNGMIGNDPVSLFKASDTMVNELRYVESGEGFYKDGSFKQHGNFAYNGAYGVEKLRAVTTLATVLNNTPWECTDADSNIVYEWILNAYRPLYADGGIFDMVQGRSISRFNRSDITTGRYAMDAIVRLAATAPAQYKKALDTFVKTQAALGVAYDPTSYYGGMKSLSSLVLVKNYLNDDSIPLDTENYTKIYGSMDKAVAHGDDYALGFSMFSSRMGGVESINNENLKGWNTSDGALTLYNGDQGQFGEGFWATVDHTRLAGITTNHETISMPANNIKTNDRDWVGGSALNVENYASVGMDFKSTISDLEAKKSWFVFGDQIVSLGAGIATTAGDYTETIVENRKIGNDNKLLVDGSEAVAAEGTEQKAANWAWLSPNTKGGAIGYYFPEETQVTLKRETRTGKWTEVNANLKPGDADEVTKDYISIAVEHGTAPTDASYGYVLLPGKTSEEMTAYAKDNGIEVLSNTKQLQAAADTKLGVSGYNFWAAGESAVPEQNGITKLTSDAPVSVTMFNDGSKKIHLAVSDPTQKGGTVTLRLEGAGLAVVSGDEGVAMSADATGMTITVNVSGRSGAALNATISSENAKEDETVKYVTVTLHYPDGTAKTETIKIDTALEEPIFDAEDEKGKYRIKWYIDEAKTTLYDFDTIVSADTELYGEYYYYELAEKKVNATFHYPDGKTETVILKQNELLSEPEFEAEDEKGKYGIKWYTDEAMTILYDFNTQVAADLDLYGSYYYKNETGGEDPDQDKDPDQNQNKHTVTLYYPDGRTENVKLDPDTKLPKPVFEASDANGKYGILWYTDEAKTTLYDFDTLVTKDTALYGVYSYYYEGADKEESGEKPTGIYAVRIEDQQYTGKAIKPDIVVYDGTRLLTEKTDYKISYANNTKVGTARITIIPCGNYEKESKFDVCFNIVPRELTEENVTIDYDSVMKVKIDKKKGVIGQTQKPTLKYDTLKIPAKEYTVSYMQDGKTVANMTNVGTYQMVIQTNSGSNYKGRLVYDVIMTDKILITDLKVSVPTQKWTGTALTPEVTVKYKNKKVTALDGKELNELFEIQYENNVNAGTGSVILTAKDDSKYCGTRTVNFTIKGTEIKKARISGIQSELTYTGKALTQKVTLSSGGKTLKEGKDYKVAYADNVNVGRAVMTITGIGEFSGTMQKTFSIGRVSLKNAQGIKVSFVNAAASKVPQDKGGAIPAVKVTGNGKTLVQDVDYTVVCSNNKAIGSNGKVTIKGIGNYTGELKNVLTFEIVPKNISDTTIKIDAADLKYLPNGKYKAKVAVYDNGTKLSAKEFSVGTIENVEVDAGTKCGTATITVEGRKNYTGTCTVQIQIKETLISSAKVKVKGTYYYDNGAEVCPSEKMLEVTIGKNKTTLKAGTDFVIEGYSNNTKTGKATMTIRGVGKYGGTKTVKYTILPKWMKR